MTCIKCNRPLSFNETGLNKKYNTGEPLCIFCLAEKLGVTPERLREKIAEFRRAGCLLFTEE